MDETAVEAALQAAGKTAPRITPDQIDACIVEETSAVFFGVLTVCVLKLRNGFTVTGESACASPENFDFEIGLEIARKNARDKIWPLEGYRLKCELADEIERRAHEDHHPQGFPQFPSLSEAMTAQQIADANEGGA